MTVSQAYPDRLVSIMARCGLVFIFIFTSVCCSYGNSIYEFDFPKYNKCKNIENIFENDINRKLTYCEVELAYPAREVVEFYHSKFEAMNLTLYSADGYGVGKWEIFNEKSGEWEPNESTPGRYIATWVDKNKTIRVIVSMRYQFNYRDKEWAKKLYINLSVQPFFNFNEIEQITGRK